MLDDDANDDGDASHHEKRWEERPKYSGRSRRQDQEAVGSGQWAVECR